MLPPTEWTELGADNLDTLKRAPRRWRWLPRRRPALGVRATAAPTSMFVLLGIAIGPAGLDILTPGGLENSHALAWVALAVIGVFIGLGLTALVPQSSARTTIGGLLVWMITVATVAGGFYLLVIRSHVPLSGALVPASLLVGLCASACAAVDPAPDAGAEARRAAHLADLDDIPLLLIGVALLTALVGDAAGPRLFGTLAAGAAIGGAGWLLFERASAAERGLFVTGVVLLLAGIGAYLGTSPLLSGCVAAIVWAKAPGAADRITAADLRVLQHPLVALLLLIAGAMTEWSVAVLWATGCIVVLRIAAKLLASVAASGVARIASALLATVLLQPGVMGVALAVNAALLLGSDYHWIVSAVALATVASEITGAVLHAGLEAAS